MIQAACAEKLFIGHWDRENTAFSSCLIAIYLAYSSVLKICFDMSEDTSYNILLKIVLVIT